SNRPTSRSLTPLTPSMLRRLGTPPGGERQAHTLADPPKSPRRLAASIPQCAHMRKQDSRRLSSLLLRVFRGSTRSRVLRFGYCSSPNLYHSREQVDSRVLKQVNRGS